MQNKIKGVFVIKINYDVIKTIIKELKTYYNMYDADFMIEFDNNTNEENVLLIYTNNEIVYQIDKFPTASKRDFENLFFLFKKFFKNYIIRLSKGVDFKNEIVYN